MRAKNTSKVVSLAAVAILPFGALGAGSPDVRDIPGDPGSNANNTFGLCTASF